MYRAEMVSNNLICTSIFSTLFLLTVALTWTNAHPKSLNEVYSWSSLDFEFPSQAERKAQIQSGSFIPGRPVPIDVDIYYPNNREYRRKVFITVPRFQDGVPVTIGYIKTNSKNKHLIAPYPNWEMQTPGGSCRGITSVYRVAIDSCDRLWIMDTGKLGENQVCPPKLVSYSLETDRQLSSYTFPKRQYSDASLYVTPIVDKRGTCNDVFVYIADVTGFGLIVYDHANSRSWRITNNLFYPYPPYGTFEINGESFDLMDGLFGLALGPRQMNGDRILYFHSLASRVESYVSTSIIRNFTLFEHNSVAAPRDFKPFKGERSSQSAAQAMDRDGVLFYGLMSEPAIGCWNSRNYPEFGGRNLEIPVVNRETLQFASGLKIVSPKNSNEQELWVITVSFQKVMTGSIDPNQKNFRIQVADISHLVRNTKCQVSSINNDNIVFFDT